MWSKIKDFLSPKKSEPAKKSTEPTKPIGTPEKKAEPLKSKSEFLKVYAPVDGTLVDQKDIPDEAFAEGHMGTGVGIDPSNGHFKIFMDGEIAVVYKTMHAYFLKKPGTDLSVMLHIGIDTVNIDPSKGTFRCERREKEAVKVGEDLCEVNLQIVKEDASSTVTPILIQNDGMEGKKVVFHKQPGTSVKAGDLLMSVVLA